MGKKKQRRQDARLDSARAWLPTYEGIEDEEIEKYWNYYVLSLNFQF